MAQQAVGSAYHLYLDRLVPAEIAHVIFAEAATLGIAPAESAHLIEGGERRRKPSPTLHRFIAVTLQHLYTKSTGCRVAVHEIQTFTDGLFADEGVGIKQQHVLALGFPDGEIVSTGKTEVVSARHEGNFTKTAAEIFHGSIARMIVYDKHLRGDIGKGLAKAQETLLEVVSNVIVYYYY